LKETLTFATRNENEANEKRKRGDKRVEEKGLRG
jgi:hypothetical protein